MASLLPLIDQSFVAAVKYRSLGLDAKAAKIFQSLMRFQDLPGTIAEQTQLHLGEIALNQNASKKQHAIYPLPFPITKIMPPIICYWVRRSLQVVTEI